MIETFGIEALYSVSTLLLASKDADTTLLKNKTDDALTLKRLNRWHKSGFFLGACLTCFCVLINPELWWFMIATCILNRASLYDLGFNKWASLDIRYIGNTAITDKIFRGIFGTNGAVLKSACFFVLLIIFNYIFRGRL